MNLSTSPRREIVLVMGSPAAGKSTAARPLIEAGYVRLNRDVLGGTLARVTRTLGEALEAGAARSFVLDNTYPTRDSRRELIELGRRHGVPVRAVLVDATLDDTLVNATWRMHERYGRLLDPVAIRKLGRKDANLFPPSVLFRHRRIFEPPTTEEGFCAVERVAFERQLDAERFRHRALLLDVDATLRTTRSGSPYPLEPSDVVVLPGRRAVLEARAARGYKLLGVSNQSGVAAGYLDEATAAACFERTRELLGVELEVAFCPHAGDRITCWCRIPMPGLGVHHVLRHGLAPGRCLVVGGCDRDREFARTLGIDYVEAERFFSEHGAPPR